MKKLIVKNDKLMTENESLIYAETSSDCSCCGPCDCGQYPDAIPGAGFFNHKDVNGPGGASPAPAAASSWTIDSIWKYQKWHDLSYAKIPGATNVDGSPVWRTPLPSDIEDYVEHWHWFLNCTNGKHSSEGWVNPGFAGLWDSDTPPTWPAIPAPAYSTCFPLRGFTGSAGGYIGPDLDWRENGANWTATIGEPTPQQPSECCPDLIMPCTFRLKAEWTAGGQTITQHLAPSGSLVGDETLNFMGYAFISDPVGYVGWKLFPNWDEVKGSAGGTNWVWLGVKIYWNESNQKFYFDDSSFQIGQKQLLQHRLFGTIPAPVEFDCADLPITVSLTTGHNEPLGNYREESLECKLSLL